MCCAQTAAPEGGEKAQGKTNAVFPAANSALASKATLLAKAVLRLGPHYGICFEIFGKKRNPETERYLGKAWRSLPSFCCPMDRIRVNIRNDDFASTCVPGLCAAINALSSKTLAKTAPRALQNPARRHPNRSKIDPGGTYESSDATKSAQEAAKTRPRAPKRRPRAPKSCPRAPQTRPRQALESPKRPQKRVW